MTRSSKSRELKAISLQFRNLASTALRSNGDDARVNIRRLLSFVKSTPLLRAEIDKAPTPTDVGVIWKQIRESRDRIAYPDDPAEELGLLHALVTDLAQDNGEEFWHRCYMYAGKHGLSECINEVLNDTVGRYTGHLRQVLELALLDSDDPAYDNRRVEVHVSGGTNQLNVAQDSARVHATQVVGADAVAIIDAANRLVAAARALHEQQRAPEAAELEEIAAAVAESMRQQTPSRFTLKSAKDRLEVLANGATVLSALAPHIHVLVGLVAKYLAA